MASLTGGTVWVNSGSWWWTGRPGVLQFTGSQRVGHDWATELNWTELSRNSSITMFAFKCIYLQRFFYANTWHTHAHTHTHTHTPTTHMSLFSFGALSSGSHTWVCIRIMLVKTQTHFLFLRLTICILSMFHGDLGNTLRTTNFDPYFSKPVCQSLLNLYEVILGGLQAWC